MDGVFNSADLVKVFQAGKYEDGDNDNSLWSQGDWNGDLDFTTGDLVNSFQTGKYSAAATSSRLAAAVQMEDEAPRDLESQDASDQPGLRANLERMQLEVDLAFLDPNAAPILRPDDFGPANQTELDQILNRLIER